MLGQLPGQALEPNLYLKQGPMKPAPSHVNQVLYLNLPQRMRLIGVGATSIAKIEHVTQRGKQKVTN